MRPTPLWPCRRVRFPVSHIDSVILVHAFLHTHAPKIAAKFASKFDNLPLAEHAEHAEELSNALVKTVKAAMLVPGSEIAKAMSYLSGKDSPELDEPAKDESHDHVKPSKKKKRDKKRKLPSEEVEDEDAQVSMEELQPAPVAPVVPETPVAEMTEVAQPRPKKPAQGERFQRVKSDNVQFLDERLKDMSYEAKVGHKSVLIGSRVQETGALVRMRI